MLMRLQRYVLFEVLKVLLLAVSGVSGIILVMMCVRALGAGLRPEHLTSILPYFVPFVLPFSVPCGVLIATVMGLGRLAGDNELMAIRCSGVDLRRVIWPVLLCGVLLAGLMNSVNNDLLPWCRREVESKQSLLLRELEIDEIVGAAQKIDLAPYQIYIGGLDPGEAGRWVHVLAVKYVQGHIAQVIIADSGKCVFDEESHSAVLTLYDGTILQRADDRWTQVHFPGHVRYVIDMKEDAAAPGEGAGTMDFAALFSERKRLQAEIGHLTMPSRPRQMRKRIARDLNGLNLQSKDVYEKRFAASGKLQAIEGEVKSTWALATSLDERIRVTKEDLENRRRLLTQAGKEIGFVLELRRNMPNGAARAKRLDQQIADMTAKRTRLQKAADTLTDRLRMDKAAQEEKHRIVAQRQAERAELRTKLVDWDAQMAAVQKVMAAKEAEHTLLRKQEKLRDVSLQIHFRMAQSAACLIFALLGIPLGMMAGRGGLVVSFGVSFAVIIFLYYPVYTVARHLAVSGILAPAPAMWLPDVICGTLGAILLWRVLRR